MKYLVPGVFEDDLERHFVDSCNSINASKNGAFGEDWVGHWLVLFVIISACEGRNNGSVGTRTGEI